MLIKTWYQNSPLYPKISHYCPPFSLTLTMLCLLFLFFSLDIFFNSPKKQKLHLVFSLHTIFITCLVHLFFFPRLFSICFAIEVNLELSFLFFWHVISDLLLKFMRHKWELPNQGLSSEKYVTSTERHFSTCYFKIFLNLNLCFILFFLN